MAVEHASPGTNFQLCSWYCWLGWWYWSDMRMQYHTLCITSDWLHHLMDPLVEGQETRPQQQLSVQHEVVTTIKTKGRMLTSSYEEGPAAMESALSWRSTNASNPSTTILFCTDSKSLVKLAYQEILILLQFTIPLTPSPIPFSFNGSLTILPFQVMN